MVEASQQLLAEVQARAMSADATTAVLVEGLSDCFAVEAAAARLGVDLADAGAAVVPMGGATNIGHYLELFGPRGRDVRLTGLCDQGEESLFRRNLERAGITPHPGFFVCVRDLEDELIRALGPERVEAVIEREGDLASLRRLQQMPFHRNRSPLDHLHRFLGVRSGRKYRYAPLLVSELEASEVPRPLVDLLDAVGTERSLGQDLL